LYGVAVDFTPKLEALAVIASALNDNNIVKAKIAAVHLRLPEIPTRSSESSDQVADVAYKLFLRAYYQRLGIKKNILDGLLEKRTEDVFDRRMETPIKRGSHHPKNKSRMILLNLRSATRNARSFWSDTRPIHGVM
jgi:hypothetical protein